VDCSENGEVLSITCFKDKIFSGHSDGTIKVIFSNNLGEDVFVDFLFFIFLCRNAFTSVCAVQLS
jgi:uncharacterized protein YuzE